MSKRGRSNSFIAFGHIFNTIFPQCNYGPWGWNRLGPVGSAISTGVGDSLRVAWRARDTAYRDKPCRRPDYGFQPSPRDRPLFPRQLLPETLARNDRVPTPEIFRLATRVTSRKWSVFSFFWRRNLSFNRKRVTFRRKFIRDLSKFNFFFHRKDGRSCKKC